MFKNVALGIIAASALAFAVSQIWVSYEYKKAANGLLDSYQKIRFEDLDLTDVDWDDLTQGIEKLKKTLE